MRMTVLVVACSAGLISAGAALADQGQPQLQQVAATQDNNPVTCHTFVHEGSLMGAGECHTKHQWESIMHREQESVREMQQRGLLMNNR